MLRDDRIGEIGAHSEVGNGADEQGDGEEVMEDLFAIVRAEAEDKVRNL